MKAATLNLDLASLKEKEIFDLPQAPLKTPHKWRILGFVLFSSLCRSIFSLHREAHPVTFILKLAISRMSDMQKWACDNSWMSLCRKLLFLAKQDFFTVEIEELLQAGLGTGGWLWFISLLSYCQHTGHGVQQCILILYSQTQLTAWHCLLLLRAGARTEGLSPLHPLKTPPTPFP